LNVGNVSLVKAPGNVALIEEMRDFPNGTHDDQVDALSRAFAALITRQAMNISSEALRRI
jgi:predicted phage terminase large subunit-like protein